jgi:hypothetical protein
VKTNRAWTTLAVGFMLLDAVLLILIGVWLDVPIAIALGGVFALIAAGLVWWYRRYQRLLAELNAARMDMKREAEGIRDLLKKTNLTN